MVHDLLAFLAERMLEMNKQKQQEIRGASWTGWRATWGAKIEDLKPKTRILSYYESDCESLLAVLRRTKRGWQSTPPPPGAGGVAAGGV